MAESLGTELGRAHLRLGARASQPAMAYEQPFPLADAPAGRAVVRWLREAMAGLPGPVCRERLAVLRIQLVSLLGQRAQLLDEQAGEHDPAATELFVHNLVDMAMAGLRAEPSAETLRAGGQVRPAERSPRGPTSGPRG
jgi:hypothetical protein